MLRCMAGFDCPKSIVARRLYQLRNFRRTAAMLHKTTENRYYAHRPICLQPYVIGNPGVGTMPLLGIRWKRTARSGSRNYVGSASSPPKERSAYDRCHEMASLWNGLSASHIPRPPIKHIDTSGQLCVFLGAVTLRVRAFETGR